MTSQEQARMVVLAVQGRTTEDAVAYVEAALKRARDDGERSGIQWARQQLDTVFPEPA